jgi:hypothetical protein
MKQIEEYVLEFKKETEEVQRKALKDLLIDQEWLTKRNNRTNKELEMLDDINKMVSALRRILHDGE